MRRFRPNIVVEGAEAWEEDHWQSLSIGANHLSVVKALFALCHDHRGSLDGPEGCCPATTQDALGLSENPVRASSLARTPFTNHRDIIRVGDPVTVNKSE